MKGNMNAYEIRTEIMRMAKEQLNEMYHQNKDKWLDSISDDNKKHLHINEYPIPPTIDDILNTANRLYDFVKRQD